MGRHADKATEPRRWLRCAGCGHTEHGGRCEARRKVRTKRGETVRPCPCRNFVRSLGGGFRPSPRAYSGSAQPATVYAGSGL